MSTFTRRALGIPAALLLAAAASLMLSPTAQAAGAPDAAIRAAHLSPTTPGVDVYLSPFSGAQSKSVWLSNVGYGQVSNYQALRPGIYTVAMRPAGASPTTAPMLSWTLNARSGAAYTVAGVGAGASVRGVVISDNLAAPPPGKGRVRVIQAASRAPVASLKATTGAVIARSAAFATVTDYATLPAGVWSVKAQSSSMPAISVVAPVDVKSGQITSILLLDSKTAGITLRTLVDSASSGTMPISAVPAGAGGTATHVINTRSGSGQFGWAVVGLLATVGLLAARRNSRGTRTDRRARHAAA